MGAAAAAGDDAVWAAAAPVSRAVPKAITIIDGTLISLTFLLVLPSGSKRSGHTEADVGDPEIRLIRRAGRRARHCRRMEPAAAADYVILAGHVWFRCLAGCAAVGSPLPDVVCIRSACAKNGYCSSITGKGRTRAKNALIKG
jgi:hypothetical protein